MSGFGSWLYDNTIGAMLNFGSELYGNTIGAMAEIGTWLWDTLTGTFTKLMDWVLSWIPGAKSIQTGAQAFSATEAENQKRVKTEGSSIGGGVGRTLGGIKNLDIGKTIGGLGETGSAVLSAINPFNWFEEGTRKVEQTGVGVLHKNEMVVPAKDVETLTAKGNGEFGSGSSFLSDLMKSIFQFPNGTLGNNSQSPIGAGAGTPSETAIETQLLRDQTISQQSMATALSLLVNEALTGDGLFVRDRLSFKNQNDMIKIQRDETKSELMPSPAQVAAPKSGFEPTEASKKIKETQAKNDPLKPAIQSINPKPTAGNIDMRRASESMKDTPIQRGLIDEARRNHNSYTDRGKKREEARRIRREQAGFATGGAAAQEIAPPISEFGNNVRDSSALYGQGMIQPIDYKLANTASAQQIANQGMMLSIGTPKAGTSEVDALSSLTRLVNQPTTASGMIAQGPLTVEPTSMTRAGEPASIRPLAQTSPAIPDMHSAIAGEKAATSPVKTEITSPELGAIASEAGDHNAKLDTLITLFQQVLTALKPTSTPITSSGGMGGDTSTKEVVHKPANFFKNPVGMVTQTPGKAILNVGTPKG